MITEKRLDSALIKRNLYLERLRKVSLFSHLQRDSLQELLSQMSIKRWHGGSIIVGQNEYSDGLYILVGGQAKEVLIGENGREMTLSILGPGDIFGAMALIGGQPSSANLLATKDSVLLVLEREIFINHINRCPETAQHLLLELANRLRKSHELIDNLALHDVASRLARTLIGLATEQGEVRDEGILLRHRPTQQELANMVGTCRETVSRVLSSMARKGLLVSKGRTILLSNTLVETRQAA